MGKGYQGKPSSRKRSRNDEDGNEKDYRNVFEERHKGSFPLDELKASDAYKNRIEMTGPKRKYAICFGYLGSNYKGLQINPDTKSIEGELEKALFLCGGIPEYNYGNLQKIQWTRAARTDAGVHAVAQCCAMRLTIPLDQRSTFIKVLNDTLPSDISVHAISKVTKGFNSKLYCTKRRYHYLMPTYLLSDQELVNKYLEEALAAGDATTAPFTTYSATPGQSSIVPQLVGLLLAGVRERIKSFRISEEMLVKLKEALQRYLGTNNYHNFTSGKSFKDAESNRYIMSFEVMGEPFIAENTGVEYVLLAVVGQSFLLNQIRKMVAMAAEVARGRASLDTMTQAFSDVNFDLPMVPGGGLYLDELFYDGYHNKIEKIPPRNTKSSTSASSAVAVEVVQPDGNDQDDAGDDDATTVHERLDWQSTSEYGPNIDEFRSKTIWPHIFDQEEKMLDFVSYLDFLRFARFSHNIFDSK